MAGTMELTMSVKLDNIPAWQVHFLIPITYLMTLHGVEVNLLKFDILVVLHIRTTKVLLVDWCFTASQL